MESNSQTKNSQKVVINDRNLLKIKYPISVIEDNIDNLSLFRILYTQHLTPAFCVKYILSEEYASCVEETYICDKDVLYHQPHIKQEELMEERIKLNE
jgi:hypothetical protein